MLGCRVTREHCDGDDTVRNLLLEGKARFTVHWIDVCTDVPVHHDHKAALCLGPHHGLALVAAIWFAQIRPGLQHIGTSLQG